MLNKLVCLALILASVLELRAQEQKSLYAILKLAPTTDSIFIEKVAINPASFQIIDANQNAIDSSFYKVDFNKSLLIFSPEFKQKQDSIQIKYLKYPDFLTQTYQIYKSENIVSNDALVGNLYKITPDSKPIQQPFNGLETSGSISRGLTVGNNQNGVVNANLDLQINGKLSDKVGLSASIKDNNLPIQNEGYSQKINQIDAIYIELFSKKWNLRVGDVVLENKNSRFLNFSKKVQGLQAQFIFDSDNATTTISSSAALVRGQYARSNFTGAEGNQGPYKLKGNNGELYVLVLSGTEKVYVNGRMLTRGENEQYVIDYDAGEISFTTQFPINSEMRIVVEYQYRELNYNRLVSYSGFSNQKGNWNLGAYFYTENDIKSQPFQQSLTSLQTDILKQAGDDSLAMVSPSDYLDTYSENKILYRKVASGSETYFEFSNNPEDILYNVTFKDLGANNGNYVLQNTTSISKIYEYAPPIAGVLQGNYEPIVQLIAPIKLQIATLMGSYTKSEHATLDFEMAVSNKDNNLYATIDDANNHGFVGNINFKQRLFSKKWLVDWTGNYQFIHQNYNTVERLNTIEYNRDWNIEADNTGNRSEATTGFLIQKQPDSLSRWNSKVKYVFEKLNIGANYAAHKQQLQALVSSKKARFNSSTSILNTDGSISATHFYKNHNQLKFDLNKKWIGISTDLEDNLGQYKADQSYTTATQKYTQYGVLAGLGDSTKVYLEIQYLKRFNDSLQAGILKNVNQSDNYVLKTRLIQNENSNLNIYFNLRKLDYSDTTKASTQSLNTRLNYGQSFWKKLVQNNSSYETFSGTLPIQEYTFVEVAAGQGVYLWNDYNTNAIQELEEFEISPFLDQAKYVKLFLPNLTYIKTQQIKLSESIILNPNIWQNHKGFKKWLAHFYNQTTYTLNKKNRIENGVFELNPFEQLNNDVLGLNLNFINSFDYNRGKQKNSVNYIYNKSNNINWLSSGTQTAQAQSHRLKYVNLFDKAWLLDIEVQWNNKKMESENYAENNYFLKGNQIKSKMSYLFSKNTMWDLYYEFQNNKNQINLFEQLKQDKYGTTLMYNLPPKFTFFGEFIFVKNAFTGSSSSLIGFQMMEGLQAGLNQTWKLNIQKRITQFMDISFGYQGRNSETSNTIHTGSVQLKANF